MWNHALKNTKIASVVNIPDNKANDDNSGEDDDEDDEEEILDDEDMTEDEEEDSEEEEDCEDTETSVKSKERRRIKASCSFLNDEARFLSIDSTSSCNQLGVPAPTSSLG